MAKRTQKPVMASFGTIVAERRKSLGISQETLAERIGVSQESLSRMERGFIAPRFERLQLFADALGCSIADLFKVRTETLTFQWFATQDDGTGTCKGPGHAQIGTSELAVALERMLSPLSDDERKEIVEIVTKIITLITARRPANRPA